MQASPVLRAMPGFWRRSLDELSRQTSMAMRMEGLHAPTKPLPLVQFSDGGSIARCKVMSDKDMGGFSQASLILNPGTAPPLDLTKPEAQQDPSWGAVQDPSADPPHATFAGSISTQLPPGKPEIQRSGYAGWRTRDRGFSLFGKLLWDLERHAYLALRVKSDGRKYFVNIQTESIVPTDLHQHLLPAMTPGKWEVVRIPFHAFVRTNYGLVVEPQSEMMTQKVRSVGIALTDRTQGPFELKIAEVYATNTPPAGERSIEDSGFDARADEDTSGMMGEIVPKRKKGEPERILI